MAYYNAKRGRHSSHVIVDGACSESIDVVVAVHQESVLSPIFVLQVMRIHNILVDYDFYHSNLNMTCRYKMTFS